VREESSSEKQGTSEEIGRLLCAKSEVTEELLEALGLDGKRIRSLTIEFTAGELVSVTTEMFAEEGEIREGLRTIRERYELVLRETDANETEC